jgi:hypothetical protein
MCEVCYILYYSVRVYSLVLFYYIIDGQTVESLTGMFDGNASTPFRKGSISRARKPFLSRYNINIWKTYFFRSFSLSLSLCHTIKKLEVCARESGFISTSFSVIAFSSSTKRDTHDLHTQVIRV